TPPAARRAAGRAAGDPRPARGAPGALVAGRGPGRPLLSGLGRLRAAAAGLGLLADQHRLALAPDLEQADRVDQRAEAAIAVVARVERALVAQVAAHATQVRPALVVGHRHHRAAQQLRQGAVVA